MLPHLSQLTDTATVVSIPLAVPFRGLTHREALLFHGPQGWSEFSPFTEYDDQESSAWLRAAIEFAWTPLPRFLQQLIPVNATVPSVEPHHVANILATFSGCTTAKVKVAATDKTLAEEVELVSEVRRILGPEGRIRLDANGGWNVDEAEHAIHAFAPLDIEYIEQPCSSLEELAQLRERISYMDIPIAADESIRKASDPAAVIAAEAADILVLKVQPLGGISAVTALASATTKPVVLSSALETSIGISMGLAAASVLPAGSYANGLGTAALLDGDITEDRLLPVSGHIQFRRVIPSDKLLNKWSADKNRTTWWLERLERCYKLLES